MSIGLESLGVCHRVICFLVLRERPAGHRTSRRGPMAFILAIVIFRWSQRASDRRVTEIHRRVFAGDRRSNPRELGARGAWYLGVGPVFAHRDRNRMLERACWTRRSFRRVGDYGLPVVGIGGISPSEGASQS